MSTIRISLALALCIALPAAAGTSGIGANIVRTGPAVNLGAANAEGVSAALSRADHVHKRPWAGQVEATELGVLCDGHTTTDDSLALQAILNTPGIIRVLLPCEKTCSILNTVTVPNHKSLIGCGGESTILEYTGTGTALKRDGVNATTLEGFRLFINGTSATNIGVLDTNVSGAMLRNTARDVQVWTTNSPPVAGSIGWFIHAVNGNSLYYGKYDHIDLNGWDKAVRMLGDNGTGANPPIIGASGGSNANKWTAPEVNASVVGFSFEGYASANTVTALHCNGGGQAFDQLCVQLGGAYGDSNTNLVGGNKVELYSDNAVGGHVGRSYSILVNAQRNEIRSFGSGAAGTNANALGIDRNYVEELNAASGRLSIQVGNIQILSDGSTPGIFISDPTGASLPAVLQNSSSNVANAILWRIKANLAMTQAGAVLMEWDNPTTRMHAIDLNGASQFAGQTFANLSSPAAPPNGTLQYCSDCKNVQDGVSAGVACVAAGNGSFAKRLNSTWICN